MKVETWTGKHVLIMVCCRNVGNSLCNNNMLNVHARAVPSTDLRLIMRTSCIGQSHQYRFACLRCTRWTTLYKRYFAKKKTVHKNMLSTSTYIQEVVVNDFLYTKMMHLSN